MRVDRIELGECAPKENESMALGRTTRGRSREFLSTS